ncbi:ABC transporter permease [Methylobrevis albus]|uniref:ABC transporter permease n=1 Tax=Methylobrevis albus TaxID=2793297 RepID=A0A931I1C8_9HYPH|nr:ABC transporter permease [Methylobrevis albus]MBH0237987.1 ABC transporter permease [Methylobrevis albus]
MSIAVLQQPGEAPGEAPGPGRPALWRGLMAAPDGRVGVGLTVAMLLLIVFGPLAAPYSPTAINLAPANQPPSFEHLLGADHLGRDVFSRFLWGGRSILAIPLMAVILTYATAGLLSLVATYRGGAVDLVVCRFFELMMSLPALLKILLLVAAFGPTTGVLIVAIAITNMPGASRVVRGAVLGEIRADYVQAAQARGEATLSVVVREILPNVLGPVAADFALRITWGIIALSTLSFLGLGVQPPEADWGLMIQESRSSLQKAPLITILPAMAIAALSIGLNLASDALVRHVTSQGNGRR